MVKINNLNHVEKINPKKIFYINIISLLMGFTSGLLVYTTSAYFKNILNTSNIGWAFIIANIIILVTLLNIHKFILIIGRETLFHLIIICKISLFIALVILFGHISSIILLILYIIFETLSITILKMILESYANDARTGEIYGFNLTITNVGLILAPIIATQLLISFDFIGIFYLSLIFNVIIFTISFFTLRQSRDTPLTQIAHLGLIQKLKSRKDIQKIFYISVALEFFFAIMVIYAPLYLLDNGFSWTQIGIIFSIMLIPFIIVQYPIGLLADKKFGEKEMLFISFILIITSSISIYFFDSTNMLIITSLFFISRIGASFINTLRLSYFYKRIDKNDTDMIAFFQIARPLAFIIAPAITGVLLIFFKLNIIFIIIAFIAFIALYPIYKLTDNMPQN